MLTVFVFVLVIVAEKRAQVLVVRFDSDYWVIVFGDISGAAFVCCR